MIGRALVLALLLACFACAPVNAQLPYGRGPFPGMGLPFSAAFSGPGDIVAYRAFWGLSAYSAATRGNAVVNVCNVADVACVDIVTDATTGSAVVTTVGGSDCSIVTCTIKSWYDGTGNGYTQTQATIAQRWILVTSCVNSLPCARGNGTTQGYSVVYSGSGFNQPLAMTWVGKRTGNIGAFNTAISSNGQVEGGFHSANNAFMYAGGTLEGNAADSAWHVGIAVFNGLNSVFNVDGTEVTPGVNPGGNSIANGATFFIGKENSAEFFAGDITEAGIIPTTVGATDRTTLCHNRYAYWGTSVSC